MLKLTNKHYKIDNIKINFVHLPLTSSSSKVVLLSVDSFTCEPSPFFCIMLRPTTKMIITYKIIIRKNKE